MQVPGVQSSVTFICTPNYCNYSCTSEKQKHYRKEHTKTSSRRVCMKRERFES